MTTNNIEQLGILEQNLSMLVSQRHSLQKQLLELEQAHSELESAQDAYQIVGTVMIKKPAKELKEELSSKKETINVKLLSIQKQEEALRAQLLSVQEEVMKNLKSNDE